MLGSFYEAFGKDENKTRDISPEVIEILNQSIPSNFVYKMDDSGSLRAVPKLDKLSEGFSFNGALDGERDPELFERLKTIPKNKWPEYIYRAKKAIPTKGLSIGDKEKVVPLEKLISDPLGENEIIITNGQMLSSPFSPPIKSKFETPDGDCAEISIKQTALDSVVECKFINVDYPALKLEIYIYDPLVDTYSEKSKTGPDKQAVFNYSITPSKATSVKEAVTALRIFKSIIDGTVTINGQAISPENIVHNNGIEQIDDVLSFWESLLKLEEILEVQFRPDAEFSNDEMKLFSELQTCLIERKAIKWKHPFDHFHATGIRLVEKEKTLEDIDIIRKESIRNEFLEGPFSFSLLGADFTLYCHSEMIDFIITSIQFDNEKKDSGELYIDDAPGETWTLSRRYITEKEKDNYINRDETKAD